MKTILIADDEPSLQKILSDALYGFNKSIICAADGEEALQILKTQNIDLAFLDIRMPKKTGLAVLAERKEFFPNTQVIILTAQDKMSNAVQAMKDGAFDYLAKPFDLDEVIHLADLALKESAERKTAGTNAAVANTETLVGNAPCMREIYKTIGKVAPQNVTVLITGESGTGKELVAKALHQSSNRADRPFVAVNCAAIPHDILESELFGHRKGAFTGAIDDKKGYFEQADSGTIFLDEISEMPLLLQTKILRFLQERQLQKVGAVESKSIDVRVLAASNRDLQTEIQKGRFREDLFFRLNVVPIAVPPLRDRREDIPRLIHHFVTKHCQKLGISSKNITVPALQFLYYRDWPGNVRELENAVLRLLVLTRACDITLEDTQAILGAATQSKQKKLEDIIASALFPIIENSETPKNLFDLYLPWIEKPLIQAALKRTAGNQLEAAQILGIHRNTLRKKIKELDIHG